MNVYLKCGLKTKERSHPRTYVDNLSNYLLKTPERSHLNLCDAGATIYQLNNDATQLGAGQFVGLISLREGLDAAQLVEHCIGIAEVVGLIPVGATYKRYSTL